MNHGQGKLDMLLETDTGSEMNHGQGKLDMLPETDTGSDLPLTLFSVTKPGLAAVKFAVI